MFDVIKAGREVGDDPGIHLLLDVGERVTVDTLHNSVRSPASALDDIFIRNTDGMKNGSSIVPEIMQAEMREPGIPHSVAELFRELIRSLDRDQRTDAAADVLDDLVRVLDRPEGCIGLRRRLHDPLYLMVVFDTFLICTSSPETA